MVEIQKIMKIVVDIVKILAQGVQLKRNPKTGVENKKVLIQWLN